MTQTEIAKRHRGVAVSIPDVAPLYCVIDADSAYQFTNAADAVAFVREAGKTAQAEFIAKWRASRS